MSVRTTAYIQSCVLLMRVLMPPCISISLSPSVYSIGTSL